MHCRYTPPQGLPTRPRPAFPRRHGNAPDHRTTRSEPRVHSAAVRRLRPRRRHLPDGDHRVHHRRPAPRDRRRPRRHTGPGRSADHRLRDRDDRRNAGHGHSHPATAPPDDADAGARGVRGGARRRRGRLGLPAAAGGTVPHGIGHRRVLGGRGRGRQPRRRARSEFTRPRRRPGRRDARQCHRRPTRRLRRATDRVARPLLGIGRPRGRRGSPHRDVRPGRRSHGAARIRSRRTGQSPLPAAVARPASRP